MHFLSFTRGDKEAFADAGNGAKIVGQVFQPDNQVRVESLNYGVARAAGAYLRRRRFFGLSAMNQPDRSG